MKRSLIDLGLGLTVGAACGYFLAVATGASFLGGPASPPAAASAATKHDHGAPLELEASSAAPTLEVVVTPDPVSGYNLRLTVTNFRFSPDQAGRAHRPGEGHAHLQVNGRKLARLYGPWFHVPALPKGEVTLDVALYSNDHRPLHHGGKPIRTVVVVNDG